MNSCYHIPMCASLLKSFSILALAAASSTYGTMMPPRLAPTDTDEVRILEEHTINIPIAGCVTGSFIKANAVLREVNLLDMVQTAYASQLPSGQKPAFVVKSTGKGQYFYISKEDERCDIRELWRLTDTNTWFQAAFHIHGGQICGAFDSLVYLTVSREGVTSPEVLNYSADVRVWPHRAWARFLVRYLPGVECYFRMKTAEMRGIITRVFTCLVSS